MIDLEKLKPVLKQYKADFRANWEGNRRKKGEKFKWEAVKWFQEHWNIEAEDFGGMFTVATRKAGKLLDSGKGNLPRRFVDKLAQADQAATREMFRALYDESFDLSVRVTTFLEASQTLWRTYYNEEYRLYSNSASTFLWLHYPDKYYVYRPTRSIAAAQYLNSDYVNVIVANGTSASMLAGYRLNDEIREELKKDADLRVLLEQSLTSDCYADPELITTTVDFINYLYNLVESRGRHPRDNPEPEPEADPDSGRQQQEDLFLLNREEQEEAADPVPHAPGPAGGGQEVSEPYSAEDFLKDVYLSKRDYEHLSCLLERKKNIILQGAPGVGKTYAAKRLAWSLMGKKDEKRIRMVQFHQSYSYDEFVMGYRPEVINNRLSTFDLKEGVFYDFCKKAERDPGNDFFFIIDEINRGNLSKIFGELLMLIENSCRDHCICLAYKPETPFSVPSNLYLIGTMNTVDRGLTRFDHALRQRFGVFTMAPAFESDGFKKYLADRNSEKLDKLVRETMALNEEITESLGKDFVIGHRWFCGKEENPVTDEWLYSIVEYEILPLLEEYWFDQEENVDKWRRKLHEALGVEDGR